MTKETAEWLLGLINSITLNVAAPDFDEAVVRVQTARAELTAILTD